MPANNLIQFRKGSSTEWSTENPVLIILGGYLVSSPSKP